MRLERNCLGHLLWIPASAHQDGRAATFADAFSPYKTLRSELVWRTLFQTRIEARRALARYIDGFTSRSDATRR